MYLVYRAEMIAIRDLDSFFGIDMRLLLEGSYSFQDESWLFGCIHYDL